MEILNQQRDWSAVGAAWQVVENALGRLCFEFTEENAERVAQQIDALVSATSSVTHPPGLDRLLDVLVEWMTSYEDANVPMRGLDPVDLLTHLMHVNDLRQRDLASIVGGQSIVSAILNRRRKINARQALALGRHFSLSPGAFIDDGTSMEARLVDAFSDSDDINVEMESLTTFGQDSTPVATVNWIDTASPYSEVPSH